MPKKIRVYELGRELGLTNKEALDLCIELGIGVKSHSSSIEDAQADRVRRKADRDGLRRPVQPEEPPPAASRPASGRGRTAPGRAEETAAAPPADLATSSTGTDLTTGPGTATPPPAAAPAAVPAPSATAPAVQPSVEPVAASAPSLGAPVADLGADSRPAPAPGTHEAQPGHRLVVSRPASELGEQARPPARPGTAPSGPGPSSPPAAARPNVAPPPRVGPPPAPPRPNEAPRTAVPAGTGQAAPAAARPAAPAGPAGQTPRPPASGAPAGAPAATGAPRPVSATGKPIPPPGGPPRSMTGRPIPPPPGVRRAATGGPPAPGRTGPGARPAGPAGPRTGFGSGRPSPGARPGGPFPGRSGPGSSTGGGAGGGGFPSRGGSPGGARGGMAPGAGGPPGARGGGGIGGRGRGPQRPKRRRRRIIEELEPIQITAYMPSSAPVPEGEIIVERGSTPQQLGPKLNRSAGDVVRFLLLQGEMVTATQALSDDMIELFAAEIGARVRMVDPGEEQEAALRARFFGEGDEEEEADSDLRPRPPIVTVMGHVDHGKTLLLDRIRTTNVVAGEAGGITQHIGAYQVDYNGHLITFIDTPGHEAFTAMRARGASVTDIVVLVVAADDGVMPQTIEAINHAKAAEVPIVVAINKIDREDADPNRVMQQLSEYGLVPEAWGGDTITVEMSALQNIGVDDLLDQLVVLSEVLELKANPETDGRGVVLEANLDTGRGPVATVVVLRGTLRVSDPIVAGPAWGRVKALINDHGDHIKEAPPSTPVQVLGLSEPPIAGDELRVTDDTSVARTVGEAREQRIRLGTFAHSSAAATAGPGAKLEDIFEQISRGETATLNLVLKADVQGSLEAVTESLRKLEREEVKIAFVHRAVGGITESDVDLAAASGATIIGFNVRPDRRGRELADARKVEIRTYEIIYKLIEDIQAAILGMLAPEFEEVVTGEAEVRTVFRVPRVGAIAGCYVLSGVITRGSKVRFLRDGVIIWKGAISSLKRFKDDAREVQSGFECGIGLTDFQDLKEHDVIETYEEREIPRT
ncbi:MAG: translation initiation factor IF-2 [Acidimicrobiales bacterium]